MSGPGQKSLTACHNTVQRCQDLPQLLFSSPSLHSLPPPQQPEQEEGIYCEGNEGQQWVSGFTLHSKQQKVKGSKTT